MSNERKAVSHLQRILLPPSSLLFFFSQPPRPAAKINVCTGRPIRIDEARRPKNAMTADDPGVIFNFKCYEIENDSDLIGNSRGG